MANRIQEIEYGILEDRSITGFEYIGYTLIGNTDKPDKPIWRILQIEKALKGDVYRWSNGNVLMNVKWEDRLTITYK